MVTLTSYRLHAVCRPWKTSKLSSVTSFLWAILCWACAIFIATVPRSRSFRDEFINQVWLAFPDKGEASQYFSRETVDLETIKNFLKKSCVLGKQWLDVEAQKVCSLSNIDGESWSTLIGDIQTFMQNVTIRGEFGFFSAHGVCLPALFPTISSDNHEVSTRSNPAYQNIHQRIYQGSVLGLNLFACLYMVIAYSFISLRVKSRGSNLHKSQSPQSDYCTVSPGRRSSLDATMPTNTGFVGYTKKMRASKRIKSRTKMTRMDKRIARIMLTNCACWIPICLMGLTGLLSKPLPTWLYSFTAVVLLPINSAINPFIYSEAIRVLVKRVRERAMQKSSKMQHDPKKHEENNKNMVELENLAVPSLRVQEEATLGNISPVRPSSLELSMLPHCSSAVGNNSNKSRKSGVGSWKKTSSFNKTQTNSDEKKEERPNNNDLNVAFDYVTAKTLNTGVI